MPMKCVVCGQLTDAEARATAAESALAEAQRERDEKQRLFVDAVAGRTAKEAEVYELRAALAEARGALVAARDWWIVGDGANHPEDWPSEIIDAALARAGEPGRGSSTDRAPGRNPGDAGSSPAPSTPVFKPLWETRAGERSEYCRLCGKKYTLHAGGFGPCPPDGVRK